MFVKNLIIFVSLLIKHLSMKYIIPLFLLSVLLSCDKEETGQLIGSFWRYEHTYTQEYEIGLDGTIRFPGSIYKDSDTVTTVTFNYQHQISFLTKDRVRFNNNRKVSTNQITDVSSETYDFYNYNSK